MVYAGPSLGAEARVRAYGNHGGANEIAADDNSIEFIALPSWSVR